MQVRSLGWENPLRESMATHYSSILAWKIPRTEEPDWPQSIGLQRGDMTEVTQHTRTHTKCFQKDSNRAIKS